MKNFCTLSDYNYLPLWLSLYESLKKTIKGGFKDHRHDQSIWSLLCKKYNIEPHKLISQWGEGMKNDFPNDTYDQITLHHRNPI